MDAVRQRICQRDRRVERGEQITFIYGKNTGNLLLLYLFQNFSVFRRDTFQCVNDKDGNVAAVQSLVGLLDAHKAKLSAVIKSGGVNEDDRTQGEKFHGFHDRICGSAFDIGNNGKILGSYSVNKAGFPGVASSENTNVDALGAGGVV